MQLQILLELLAFLKCDWFYVGFLNQGREQLDRYSASHMEILVVSI